MKSASRTPWMIAGAVVVAAGLGFAVARLTAPAPAPAPAPEAEHAEAAAPEGLKIDAQRITAAGIGVEPAVGGGIGSEILAPATVHADPSGEAILSARASGSVTRILKRLGDPVRAGETVAVVESRDASAIAADRSSAEARATLAQRRLERERRLFDQKVSPRQDVEQAEAEAAAAAAEVGRARAAAAAARVAGDGRSVTVSSPISGRIAMANTALGAFVQADTELFRVADPARIQVEAQVAGADAARIAPGDRAVVELPGGGTALATVRAVTPSLNAESRSATAVLALSGAAPGLQPGAAVRARISPSGGAAAPVSAGVLVPEEAVQRIEGRDAVFVRTPEGFRAQDVVVGARSGGRAEIVSGLSPGQQIAVRNAFILKAEMAKGEEEGHEH